LDLERRINQYEAGLTDEMAGWERPVTTRLRNLQPGSSKVSLASPCGINIF